MRILVKIIGTGIVILLVFSVLPIAIWNIATDGAVWTFLNWGLDLILLMTYFIEFFIGGAILNILAGSLILYIILRYWIPWLSWLWERVPFN